MLSMVKTCLLGQIQTASNFFFFFLKTKSLNLLYQGGFNFITNQKFHILRQIRIPERISDCL